MKKRLLSILLALCLVLTLLPGTVWAATTFGSCGDNVTWSYSDDTLTIQGTGDMADYYYNEPPWVNYLDRIETVIIVYGVTGIGANAFGNCSNLTNISIPNSVTSIRDAAFFRCSNLTSVTIPDSVIAIDEGAFEWCSNLTNINVASGNPSYSSKDGVLFNAEQTFLHTYPAGKNGLSYNIPDSVSTIGADAFTWCDGLTSVTIPNSVTIIKYFAFAYCSSLTSVTIPNRVISIEAGVFKDCSSLTSVTIPNSVTSIGAGAFLNCGNLTDVYYSGSESLWGQIAIDKSYNGNDALLNATIHFNSSIGQGRVWLEDIPIKESDRYTGNQGDSFINKIGTRNGTTDTTGETYEHGLEAWIARWNYTNELSWAWATYQLNGEYTTLSGKIALIADSYNTRKFNTTIEIWGDSKLLYSAILTPEMTQLPVNLDVSNIQLLKISLYDNEAVSGGTSFALGNFALDASGSSTEPDDSSPSDENYFELQKDTNKFVHNTGWFYSQEDIDNGNAHYQTFYADQLLVGTGLLARGRILYALNCLSWEDGGACFGISTSMILNSVGRLFASQDYWDLGKPVDNTRLRDVIHFYQLLQYRREFQYDFEVSELFTPSSGGSLSPDLPAFLEHLVQEAKRSEEEKHPFIFGYEYYTTDHAGGHAVVVCGYTYDNSKNEHQIKIYDPNTFRGDDDEDLKYIRYRYMFVPDDFLSFEFTDANYVTLQDAWYELHCIGIDTLKNSSLYALDVSHTSGGFPTTRNSVSEQVQISVNVNTPFTIMNANGDTLIYDGTYFSGTMNVYSYKAINSADGEIILTVDPSEKYVVENFGDGFEISAEIDGGYYNASADGANTILLSKDDGIVFKGKNYTFSSAVSVSLDTCDLVAISGSANGNCQLELTDDGVSFNGQDFGTTVTDVMVGIYRDMDYEEKVIDDVITSLEVSDGNDDDTEITVVKSNNSGFWVNPFTDVSESDWFYDGVAYVAQNGLMQGVGGSKFNPSGTTSRGMIVTILYRLEGEPTVSQSTFTDVAAGQWYTDAVAWAAANRIVEGYGNNTFGPNDNITREQMATILYRYADYKGYDVSGLANLSGYADAGTISSWALTAVRWANNESLINGRTTTTLVPDGTATRAEAATILMRFCQNVAGLE